MRPHDFTLTSRHGPLRLYSTSELLRLPPPRYLIDGLLPAGGVCGLYGLPGASKTFLALDLALHVATGQDWLDHDTETGNVLYVAAEGGTGISLRVHAWLKEHGLSEHDLHRIAWLMESVPMDANADEMAALLERIAEADIPDLSLIVIDTMARCFEGDEVKTEDMSRFISGVDLLRKTFGCTVLIIHHPRLDGTRERGNTAFRGAADCMMALQKEGNALTLSCNKMKDDADFEDIFLELKFVPLSGDFDSCVIVPSSTMLDRPTLMSHIVDVLRQGGSLKWDDWMAATGLSRSQFTKGFNLVRDQVVKHEGGTWGLKSSTQ